jgi:isoleucyl-tRNA synthetase
VAALDPELTPALRSEGVARELVSRIQRLRKDAGYQYTTRIALWIDGAPEVLDAIRPHADAIAAETLARALALGARAPAPDTEPSLDVDGTAVVVGMQRYDSL